MTECRVSERSDRDVGDAEDRRSDAPMDVVMEMVTAKISIATEIAGTTMLEPMERNANGKRSRTRRVALAARNNWGSHMERTIRQQAQELMLLH